MHLLWSCLAKTPEEIRLQDMTVYLVVLGLGVLLAGGRLLRLFARPGRSGPVRRCTKCDREVRMDEQRCPDCGADTWVP